MDTSTILVSIAVQFPLLVLFVIYNERKDRQFQTFLEKRDDRFLAAIEKLTSQFEKHDDMTSRAISTMDERTRPRRAEA